MEIVVMKENKDNYCCNKEDCNVAKNHQELLEYLIDKHKTEIKRLQEDIHNQKILNIINSSLGFAEDPLEML